MRSFSSAPSLALVAACIAVSGGCSLIAAPDEGLLETSSSSGGGDGGGTTTTTSSTGSTSSTTSSSSGGGDGGGTTTSTSSSSASSSGSTGGGGTGGTGTGGTGGTGGQGGAGGAGGQGGQGGGPECVDPVDCPDPGTECILRTCDAGTCGTTFADQGTLLLTGQTVGDCLQVTCDGAGSTEEVIDDLDEPDPVDCVQRVCDGGVIDETNDPIDTPCGAGDALFCDGNGECVGCTDAGQCDSGPVSECQSPTCDAGVCGFFFEAEDTVIPDGDGNCNEVRCDDAGNEVDFVDNTDVPVDGFECTADLCNAGTPSNPPLNAGTSCVGGVCDGATSCVECLVELDCGTDTACADFTCQGDNTCDTAFAPNGTAAADPSATDCVRDVCDGSGGTTSIPDDTETPVDDGNPCTTQACSGGAPQTSFVSLGTACGAGMVCDGAGSCVVGCSNPDDSECAVDTACRDNFCDVGNFTCDFTDAPATTVVTDSSPTDCVDESRCNGSGGTTANVPDDTETPADDALECTTDTCSGGTPTYTPASEGTVCTGGFCRADGQCVECIDGNDCASGSCTANACDPVLTIGFCRLQFPPTISQGPGSTSPSVFGRIFVAGLTDQSDTNNVDPLGRLVAQVGYGPDGTLPGTAGWVFTAAAPNAGYNGTTAGEPNNDEYQGNFILPVAGSYDVAFRVSGDGGMTFTDCDTGAGSSDGYAVGNAGVLTSAEGAFFSEYVEGSAGSNKALEIFNPGAPLDLSTCSVSIFVNGSGTGSSTTLSGTLATDDTFVICNSAESDFDDLLCDLRTTTVVNFNGDDALALICGGVTLDVIGQIGTDPGAGWGTTPEDTVDVVLRRECAVRGGDRNGTDAFDPGADWIGADYVAGTADDNFSVHCP